MTTRLIAGELDDGEFVLPPILPDSLVKDSRKPLVHAIREHKWDLSESAGRNVGWLAAKKDFIEKGYIDYWKYGFKYGYRAKASLKVDPKISIRRCQDFKHFVTVQKEAAEFSMLEIRRRAYGLDEEVERDLFNKYQAKYWAEGFREGFCGYACPCHGCENSLKLILMSEPEAVKKSRMRELEAYVSV
jgi:hypothetical protein